MFDFTEPTTIEPYVTSLPFYDLKTTSRYCFFVIGSLDIYTFIGGMHDLVQECIPNVDTGVLKVVLLPLDAYDQLKAQRVFDAIVRRINAYLDTEDTQPLFLHEESSSDSK